MAQSVIPFSKASGELDQRLRLETQVHAEVDRQRCPSQLLDLRVLFHPVLLNRHTSELLEEVQNTHRHSQLRIPGHPYRQQVIRRCQTTPRRVLCLRSVYRRGSLGWRQAMPGLGYAQHSLLQSALPVAPTQWGQEGLLAGRGKLLAYSELQLSRLQNIPQKRNSVHHRALHQLRGVDPTANLALHQLRSLD